jgi:hypothetical protein
MSCVRIQTDATERIQCTALDASTDPLTGVTDLLIAIQRVSDGFWYDFNDDTFKASGWTTRQLAMIQVSVTLAPGEYYYDFDTSSIVSPTANDTYMIYVDQSPGTTVKNVPITGEVKVGQFVDNLDQKLSTTESNIRGSDSDDLKDLSDQIDALPTAPTAAAIADQVWDEAKVGHVGAGSFGEEVQSHATPTEVKTQADQALVDYDPPTKAELDTAESNIRGTDGDDLKDISDQIDSLPSALDIDTTLSGSHGAGSWQGDTAANIADAVWDEAKVGHVGVGSFGEEVQTHATPTEVKSEADQALVDYDPPTKAELDTAESNIRGTDGDDLKDISDQIDAIPAAPSAAVIADQVWDEAKVGHVAVGSFGEELQDKPTASEIDTELSGSHGAGSWEGGGSPSDIADAVWDEPASGHVAAGSMGKELQDKPSAEEVADQVWDEATAGHSGVGSFGEELLDKPSVSEIDNELISSHGGGSWNGTSPVLIADQVWDEIRSGHIGTGSFGETVDALAGKLPTNNIMGSSVTGDKDDEIDAIKAKTDQLNFSGANVQARVADKGVLNDPSAADIDSQLTGSHGAGSWQAASVSPAAIADAVWDEAAADHVAAGSMGKELQDKPTAPEVDTELSGSHGSGSWEQETKEDIADQVWDEAKSGHVAVGSFGEEVQSHATPVEVKSQADQALIDYDPPTKAELDATETNIRGADGDDLKDLSDQIDTLPSAVDVDTQLSGIHGSGSWEGDAAAGAVADAVWDEGKAGHTAPGSFGEEVQTHATPTEVKAQSLAALGDYGAATDSDVATAESNIRGGDNDDLKDLSDQLDGIAVSATAIDSRLPASPGNETTLQASHSATQADIAAVQLDVTSIKTTIEARTTVKQNVSYNSTTNTLVANVWTERSNLVQPSPSNLTFTLYDEDGVVVFIEVVTAPDTQGFFKVSKVQALTKNKAYYIISQLTLGSVISSGKGAFTVG